MCFVTVFVGAIGLLLYWIGFLDRPKFQVIQSVLGLGRSQVYAIVTSVKDLDYIDGHICTILKGTKKAIEASIVCSEAKQDKKLSIATSQMVSDGVVDVNKPGVIAQMDTPNEDDAIGLTIFLQDPKTGECHQTAIGFLVETSDFEYAQEIAKKATTHIQNDLGRGRNGSRCSQEAGSADHEAEGVREEGFFQAHAVALGGGPILRGRIPIRSRFAFYVARLLHWGRAHAKYTGLSESGGVAVACEIYVNGQQNPAIGSVFVDYMYLLDRKDQENVWKHLETPLPSS